MDREKAINCLTDIENIMIARQEICPREELQYWIELQEGVADALSLLKVQETVEHACEILRANGWKETEPICSECEAVHVIRCKDCKFYQKPEYGFTKGDCTYRSVWYQPEEDGFCSKAKVKD